jgi:molybdate transport system permease protein
VNDVVIAVHEALPDQSLAYPALLTLKVCLITLAAHLFLGLGCGWALAQPRWPGRTLLDVLITLPLIFPPLALGFLLLVLLGRRSVVGGWMDEQFGLSFVFSVEGVILASIVAGLPLVVKPIEAAIAGVSRSLGEASRSLGRSEWETFVFMIVPNIKGALLTGLVLATARSLGEVGITFMLGGNIVGRTNAVSLEIYNAVFNGEYDRAMALSILLGIASVFASTVLRRLQSRTTRPQF